MKILFDKNARSILGENDFKYIALLEFNKKFELAVLKLREKYDIKLDQSSISNNLIEDTFKVLNQELFVDISTYTKDLKIPTYFEMVILSIAVFDFVTFIQSPITVYGINDFSFDNLSHIDIKKNKGIKPIRPYPIIEINRPISKPALLKYIGEAYDSNIFAALEEIKNKSKDTVEIIDIPSRDIETDIKILRLRNDNISFSEIVEILEKEGKHMEEDGVRKRFERIKTTLITLNF